MKMRHPVYKNYPLLRETLLLVHITEQSYRKIRMKFIEEEHQTTNPKLCSFPPHLHPHQIIPSQSPR